jgi:hypothetical protein
MLLFYKIKRVYRLIRSVFKAELWVVVSLLKQIKNCIHRFRELYFINFLLYYWPIGKASKN